MHGEKNDRGGAKKSPPPMGLGLMQNNIYSDIFW